MVGGGILRAMLIFPAAFLLIVRFVTFITFHCLLTRVQIGLEKDNAVISAW